MGHATFKNDNEKAENIKMEELLQMHSLKHSKIISQLIAKNEPFNNMVFFVYQRQHSCF